MYDCRVLRDRLRNVHCACQVLYISNPKVDQTAAIFTPRTLLQLLDYGRRDPPASTRSIGRPDRMFPMRFTFIRNLSFLQDFQGQKTTELISTIILATAGVRLALDVVSV